MDVAGRRGGVIQLDLGTPNPKQRQFFESRARYTAYGGARGGGKSWADRVKCIAGALHYPGIKILYLRRTYPELENTAIHPMLRTISSATLDGRGAGELLAGYNATARTLSFCNGSSVKFGHLQRESAVSEYQGQEYDWIMIDEATQFTEWEFRVLSACLRGVNQIPKRMYLTCNPGGVGHMWVKRLFVDRAFTGRENPSDYAFIPATVEDNTALLASDGGADYANMLDALPDDVRAAWRYGDWTALAGQYFGEFTRRSHVVRDFRPPEAWLKYRAFDYGLDMFACLWVAVDFEGRAWVYREVQQPGLIVSDAAALMRALTPREEDVACTIAPPDMWSTLKDSGRTMAETFAAGGVGLVKAPNARVQGWMALKEYLKRRSDGRPGLLVTESCRGLIQNLPALQRDERSPSDCATEPHSITHITDALRYFAAFRAMRPEAAQPEEGERPGGYEAAIAGGSVEEAYIRYGDRGSWNGII